MPLPNFLIIGAMKAGTTTLYRDLYTHLDIFLPSVKEPNALCSDEVLTARGRRAYLSLFSRARPGQLCGEASTHYSMLPDYPGVPRRAKLICGEDLKVIYMIRDPIARIRSQHQHETGLKLIHGNINDLVRTDSRFINYSNYPTQLRAWLDWFPWEHVKVIHFEEYVRDRIRIARNVCDFLGVDPHALQIDTQQAYNPSSGKPVAIGVWRKLIESAPYRNWVKPALPPTFRDTMRSVLLPRSTAARQELSIESREYIHERLGFQSVSDIEHDHSTAPDPSHAALRDARLTDTEASQE